MDLSLRSALAGMTLLAALAVPAEGAFVRITSNAAQDIAGQLDAAVSGPGDGYVLFTIKNSGPTASAIAGVYFDLGGFQGLSGPLSVLNTLPGVEFVRGGKPAELPGANNAVTPFETSVDFTATAQSPVSKLGVNPGESLGIQFVLATGYRVADVQKALDAGWLRIGLHVQAIGGGPSDSFVTSEEDSRFLAGVSEPSTYAAGLGALALLGGVSWKNRKPTRPPGAG